MCIFYQKQGSGCGRVYCKISNLATERYGSISNCSVILSPNYTVLVYCQPLSFRGFHCLDAVPASVHSGPLSLPCKCRPGRAERTHVFVVRNYTTATLATFEGLGDGLSGEKWYGNGENWRQGMLNTSAGSEGVLSALAALARSSESVTAMHLLSLLATLHFIYCKRTGDSELGYDLLHLMRAAQCSRVAQSRELSWSLRSLMF